jgi:hypothetical protein
MPSGRSYQLSYTPFGTHMQLHVLLQTAAALLLQQAAAAAP